MQLHATARNNMQQSLIIANYKTTNDGQLSKS